ncbi:SIMPL domain-containing protein [Nanoarchaeota archaeon]
MKKLNTNIIITLIISSVILIIAFSAFFMFRPVSAENNISIEGTGTVNAMSDKIAIYFDIRIEADTSSEASSLNSQKFEELIAKLEDKGIKKDEIILEDYDTYEDYDYYDDYYEDYYEFYASVRSLKIIVDINEKDKINSIIDAVVDVEGMVNYIEIELTQEAEDEYKQKAVKLASENAKSKANSVAEGFNKKIGNLLSVQVVENDYYDYYYDSYIWETYYYDEPTTLEDAKEIKYVISNSQFEGKEIAAEVIAVFELR